jgi:antitoxin component of RelBE/YafQ-DinJ toxin-antitoxin module
MIESMNQDVMKTISARLSVHDAELFQSICEEYTLTQSEAIRFLIQSLISQTLELDYSQVKELFALPDFEDFQLQRETDKFYKNFKIVNRKELSRL